MNRAIRIGTRASPLALVQAEAVRAALISAHALDPAYCQIVKIVASGDKVQDRALAEIGGKVLWTRELDQALARGEIDMAVHSMKDVETLRPPQFRIAAMLERADVRDRLIGAPAIVKLRQGAVVGTASPRRRAQLLRLRPDLNITLLRGNVATRLAKVESGAVDATLLAAAGLARLGMAIIGTPIPLETMLPAPAQGAIGVEVRANDARVGGLVAAINHAETFTCVMAERTLLEALGGSCHSALAALALPDRAGVHLRAEIYSEDGIEVVRRAITASPDDMAAIRQLGTAMLAEASPRLRHSFKP
ncbi:MAG: hydroxymethylbilane synthase [Alphaproteobacteria bacterium]|nr:hydroxymethylbilane synthase [Alphaproteobacteria bacterium]MDE2041837.1 hydroxymethylbilane synthase [Alphaproteobacteria bacterium]MDE2341611.1 hydroxymethylbilane synthase [Alphaproteobacteria bacterium]